MFNGSDESKEKFRQDNCPHLSKGEANLFYALEYQFFNINKIKDQLKRVHNLNIKLNNGKAPIHYIVEHACYDANAGWKQLLEEILSGQNANSSTINHARSGSICSKSNVIDINAKYRRSKSEISTPLSIACAAGNINVVRVLLKSGANPNLCNDKNSIMPLWDILRLRNTDILTEFFKHKAKIDASPEQESLITQGIINQYDRNIVEILLPHMSSKQKTEVLKSIKYSQTANRAIEITKLLLEEKTNFYSQEEIKEIRKIHSFDLSAFYRVSLLESRLVESRFVELLYKHLIKNYDQGILKGLFNSVMESNNVEGFKRKLEEAKDVGFDFFNIKLDEDYELNGVVIQKGTGLAEDMLANGRRYSEELIKTFFSSTVITEHDVINFHKKVSAKFDLRECNLNFVKLLLYYASIKDIKIDRTDYEKISGSIISTMARIMLYDRSDRSQVREDISQLEKVMYQLIPFLGENEREKLKCNFENEKSRIEEKLNTPTPIYKQQEEPINCDSKKQSPVIFPRYLIIIAAGAIGGVLAYFLAPLILGAGIGIGAKLGLAVAGAVVGAAVGAGIRCLTDVTINKYCDNKISQQLVP
uniref:hypothetical protein n=1 Tax=Wolbachia endosymbiont of Folsomia candida TaxID=169402 RepID=UPI0039790BAB